MKTLISYLAIFALLIGCHANRGEVLDSAIALFESGIEQGKAPEMIDEASGLAASITNKGAMWTHNDSGHQPRLFLISETAELQAIVTLEGVENRDWEDIVVGPGPEENKSCIYISEIGDNNGRHTTKYIYRVEEPVLDTSGEEPVLLSISEFTKISIEYPDGKRDAETIFIDHNTKDLYIVSKREASVNVYVLQFPESTGKVNVLKKLGSLPFHNVVAGDISIDNEILLKTYDNIYYWKIDQGKDIYSTLTNRPITLPYKSEPQGESITWKRDGSGFYTLSEKNGFTIPDLLFYHRK